MTAKKELNSASVPRGHAAALAVLAAMKSNQGPARSPALTSAFNYRKRRERLELLGRSAACHNPNAAGLCIHCYWPKLPRWDQGASRAEISEQEINDSRHKAQRDALEAREKMVCHLYHVLSQHSNTLQHLIPWFWLMVIRMCEVQNINKRHDPSREKNGRQRWWGWLSSLWTD